MESIIQSTPAASGEPSANGRPAPSPRPPATTTGHARTDLGIAERFAQQQGGDVRFCHAWGKWLVWDGRRWRVDENGEIIRRAKLTARSIYNEAAAADTKDEAVTLAKFAAATEKRERLAAMVALAESEQPIPIQVEQLDRDPYLLNCFNGTLDLRTGELREHRRENYITKICDFEYPTQPGVDPHPWLAFLDRIFDSNAGLIQFVRRLMGYSLVGEACEQILALMHGPGSNGKTVLVETWLGMLGGDFACKAPSSMLMRSRGERHPTEVAMLHGKRLVACTETAEAGTLNESLVKELTGNDTLTARRMREDFWSFRPSHLLVLSTNHRPVIRETSHAIWRRIRLVPFLVTIPEAEQDPKLIEKLRAEWPLILRWCVAGCIEWQSDGLGAPPEVVGATSSYRADEDIIGSFVSECCAEGPGLRVRASDVYGAFKAYCERTGEPRLSQKKFGPRLAERFERKKDASNRYVYLGIGLLPDDPDHSDHCSV